MKSAKKEKLINSVTIGIITALPKEYAALCNVLGCETEVDAEGQGGGRKYTVGNVTTTNGGKHVAAVALLTDMGNNSAAIRAMLMASHFPKVEHFIMVGIAGAVPNPTKASDHVRLGDIVISDKNGVIQYDFDKEEKEFTEHRHSPRPPSAALIDAVNSLVAGQLGQKHPWEAYIKEGIEKLGKGWKRPRAGKDILNDTPDPANAVAHPSDAERRRGQPRVFHGPIASANKLLKNPDKRNALRDKFKVKAVEMEGSGVADASWNLEKGYLVIRGTCDYCNSGKGDDWQNYAALAAAAYARSVIEALAPVVAIKAESKKKPAAKKQPANRKVKVLEHERDLEQLERIFYWINLNALDHFITGVVNGRLRVVGADFSEFFGTALNSANFHLYDTKLKSLIVDFYQAWDRCLIHINSMDLCANGIELRFTTRMDLFVSKEQEREFKETVSRAQPLRNALDAMLDHVRKHFKEINLSECGKDAVAYYLSEED